MVALWEQGECEKLGANGVVIVDEASCQHMHTRTLTYSHFVPSGCADFVPVHGSIFCAWGLEQRMPMLSFRIFRWYFERCSSW